MIHARRSLILGAAGLLLSGPATLAQPVPGGQATLVIGEAIARLEQARRSLATGSAVFVGDRVATGPDSRAVLKLGETTSVRLGAGTRITVDKFVVNAGGTLDLSAGSLLMDKQPGTPEVTIRSPYGLIAVRGTELFAGPSNGVFGVFVSRGSVTVRAAGREVTLRAGEGTNIAKPGAAPTPAAAWGQARIGAALAAVY